MESFIQDDPQLIANPAGTLATFKLLGADRVRISFPWYRIAPSALAKHAPKHFNPSNPASYPARNWASFDAIDRIAAADGLQLDITLTGPAPRWATGGGQPPKGPHLQWKPNARQFRFFTEAAGKRYSGTYTPPGSSTPLPPVSFWAIWNEPNFGPDLGPQAINRSSIETSPTLYRNLLDSAWLGLHRTGHGSDKIIFGELAPRGYGNPPVFPGNFAGMKPLVFLRALYCVDSRYRRLNGTAASDRGCPRNGSASAFRNQHPALFRASAFAMHPYPQGQAPNVVTRGEPDFIDLPVIHKLERVLDTLQHVWGSGKRFGIYSTEYGYQTRPPDKRFRQPTPTVAAYYENWGEYISWKDSRIRSFMHYLLRDPDGGSQFPSGLIFHNGKHKATFDAWRMPLYLPHTKGHRGNSLEVWGCVRPEDYNVSLGAANTVQIQYRQSGAYTTIQTVPLSANGYFDVRVKFPASGSVRLAWAYPDGSTIYSRTESIKLT
jgi:hypothetical protein